MEVDLNRLEFRVQVQLRPVGNLTNDGRTPAHNLRLFLNASRGSQEIDFPTGEIMKPVEPKFFLDGNTNRYPFDRQQTTLLFLLTAPGCPDRLPTSATPALTAPATSDPEIGAAALKQVDVPICLDLAASIGRRRRVTFPGRWTGGCYARYRGPRDFPSTDPPWPARNCDRVHLSGVVRCRCWGRILRHYHCTNRKQSRKRERAKRTVENTFHAELLNCRL